MAKLPYDETYGDSPWCSQSVACDLLGISMYKLQDFCPRDLDWPLLAPSRTLYKRKQVMALLKILGRHTAPPWYGRGRNFVKVKLHLTRDECTVPSTWWYQAREIADRLCQTTK